jgi:phage shock protein A
MTQLTKMKEPGILGLRRFVDGAKTAFQSLLDHEEHPVVSPEMTIAKLEDEIAEVERTAAYMIGTERDLLGSLEDAAFLAGELGLRAGQAAEEGRDFVVRQMLEEKAHYDDVAAELRVRYQDTRARARELVQKLYDLKERLYTMKKRQALRQN